MSLHTSLNQAKKTMRESIGLTLKDDPEDALKKYMHMHDFLNKSTKLPNKLTAKEKKLKNKVPNLKNIILLLKKLSSLKLKKELIK